MKDTRKEILNSLEVLVKELPDQRVGQIIYNCICSKYPNGDTFYISDEKMLKLLEETINKINVIIK